MSEIHTLCKGCGFAVFENGEQVDCAAGRLDLFRKKKVVVEEKDDAFVIHRYCNMSRHPAFVEKYESESIPLARQEIIPKVDVIIALSEQDSYNALNFSLHNLSEQSLPFNMVYISINSKMFAPSKIVEMCQKHNIKNYKVNQPMEFNETIVTTIEGAIRQLTGMYYIVLRPGIFVATDMIQKLDVLINDELAQPVLINSYKNYPEIISRLVHIKLNGNEEYLIQDKILDNLKENNKEHLKFDWTDL